jgi:hypothetical protein
MVMERHYTPLGLLAGCGAKIMMIVMDPGTELRHYRDVSSAVLAWRRWLP